MGASSARHPRRRGARCSDQGHHRGRRRHPAYPQVAAQQGEGEGQEERKGSLLDGRVLVVGVGDCYCCVSILQSFKSVPVLVVICVVFPELQNVYQVLWFVYCPFV